MNMLEESLEDKMMETAIYPGGRKSEEGATEKPVVAILIPCYNEELTIETVVRDFRSELPDADIYVYDNNSSDRTTEIAEAAGAIVGYEKRQGKGYVVQSMFSKIDADIFVMVDGDGTYPPKEVHKLIAPVVTRDADMVVGSRLHDKSQSEFRSVNRLGNRVFLKVLNSIFKVEITDLLSGYRAFSRQFVKDIPIFGGGFEIETELTIKALERGYRLLELPVDLTTRPEGSFSKIRIAQDGMRIMNMILALFRDYKPLTFFGLMGIIAIVVGFIPGLIVVTEFLETGLVRRLPSAILAVGLVLAGMFMLSVGLVLHTIVRRSQEFDHKLQSLSEELGHRVKKELANARQ